MNTRTTTQFCPYICYTIWINPAQNAFLNTISLYPQPPPPELEKIDLNDQIFEKTPNQAIQIISDHGQRQEEFKTIGKQEKNEVQKKKIAKKENQKQKARKIQEASKSKRPLTYETQKSFYMKQKLKGKMRCNYRILRKRTSQALGNCIKNKLRAANSKKQKKEVQKTKKIQKIRKIEEKEQKTVKKIKTKIIKEYCQSEAIIPPLVCGYQEMNQFILNKIQNLKLRQLGKK